MYKSLAFFLLCISTVAFGADNSQNQVENKTTNVFASFGNKITSITIDDLVPNLSTPITLGQPFKKGDIPQGYTLIAQNSAGETVNIQLDKKSMHKDGSLRHGIISTVLAKPADNILSFYATRENAVETQKQSLAELIRSGVSAKVIIKLADKTYTAELNAKALSNPVKTWLDGSIVGEWVFKVPFKSTSGRDHNRLHARFNIRKYSGQDNARIEIVVENTKLLWKDAQDISYGLQIIVDNREVFTQPSLYHFNHARWRKMFWWGKKPKLVHIKHDTPYLIATKAVPNYDQSFSISELAIREDDKAWHTRVGSQSALKANETMGSGLIHEHMPATGGRADIGSLPRWAVRYLLSMDKREKLVTLGTADQGGSFRIHIRDPKTDLPISLNDHPEASMHPNLRGRSTYIGCSNCPKANFKNLPERVPYSPNAVYTHSDTAHQPSLAYLPYLVTGDHYYLEEMHFWAAYNTLMTGPSLRERSKGLFKFQQTRGMAWSLRKLSRVAYITPDSHPRKKYWEKQLNNNIQWLTARYIDNKNANKLGILTHGYALYLDNGTKKIATKPWMIDFLTPSLQQIYDFGYSNVKPILNWQAQFPVNRLTTPEYCWISAAVYSMSIADSAPKTYRNTKANSSDDFLYRDWSSIYRATFPAEIRQLACGSTEMAKAHNKYLVAGEMTGYSRTSQGYPSILQAAVASAVDAGIPKAKEAWEIINNRKKKPDYGRTGPEFAIIPRPQ